MTKDEAFKTWWHNEGSQAPHRHHDCEEHTMRMCEIAWANGAYKEREALAQPKQEPVRVMGFDCVCGKRMKVSAEQGVTPAPQRKPLDRSRPRYQGGRMSNPHWCTYCKGHNAHNCQFNEQLPRMHTYTTNHTSPPQSTWVGLTDEEVASIYMNHTDRPDRPIYEQWKFARAIEAKLKEKNGFDTPELAHQAYKENT